MQKKVSVIIPCHNSMKYLDYCFQSLIDQTIGIENMELIFVDDASTDETLQRLLEFEQMAPESIMIIPLTENMMQGGARNIALTYATGQYILFLDSDDWIVQNAVELLYNTAEEQRADIVEFQNQDVDSYDSFKDRKRETSKGEVELVIFTTKEERKNFILSEKSKSGCWDKLYRTSFVKECTVKFAEHVAYEEPLFVYPTKFYVKRQVFLKECLHYCFQNPEGTTKSLIFKENHKLDHLIVQLELQKNLEMRGLLEDYGELIEFNFTKCYFVQGLLFTSGRGFIIDLEMIHTMQEKMKQYAKNVTNNPYIKEIPLYREMAKFVTITIDETNIEEFNLQINQIVQQVFG
ncbi:MAG: glycosyltransferase family 2 protein [Lachnospiraceae bacterium]|nr:glycosyltransferase family 2 protein [Lachnospiraceae bacterium]